MFLPVTGFAPLAYILVRAVVLIIAGSGLLLLASTKLRGKRRGRK
jgi:hypothetical protein